MHFHRSAIIWLFADKDPTGDLELKCRQMKIWLPESIKNVRREVDFVPPPFLCNGVERLATLWAPGSFRVCGNCHSALHTNLVFQWAAIELTALRHGSVIADDTTQNTGHGTVFGCLIGVFSGII